MNLSSQHLMMMGHNYLGIEFTEFAALCRNGENMLILGKNGSSFYKLFEFTEASVTQAIWSQDGQYLCAFGTASGFHMFKRTGNGFVKVQTITSSYWGAAGAAAFSPNGLYAVTHMFNSATNSGVTSFWKISDGVLSGWGGNSSNTGNIIKDSNVNMCSWSQSGTYLLAPRQLNQNVSAYKVGGTAEAPTFTEKSSIFSRVIASAINGIYYYAIYESVVAGYYYLGIKKVNTADDTFTSLYNIQLSTTSIYKPKSLKVSRDGTYVVVGMSTATDAQYSGIFVFKRSSDTFTDITTSQTNRLWGQSPNIEFAPDGNTLYTLDESAYYGAKVWTRSGDNLFFSSASPDFSAPLSNNDNVMALWPSAIYSS